MHEKPTMVIVSGYFNPFHIGHLKMFQAAKTLGDELFVIVNNDEQQIVKKGKIIINEEERLELIKAVRYVDKACIAIDSDQTVCKTLKHLAQMFSDYYLIFANGGDKNSIDDIPETDICDDYDISMRFGVGGTEKLNSSSDINSLNGKE